MIEKALGIPGFVLAGLNPGHCYVLFQSELVVFGKITESECEEDRLALLSTPHLRMVRAFSVACPRGELGHAFVGDMHPISKWHFEKCKEEGWVTDKQMAVNYASMRSANLKAVCP